MEKTNKILRHLFALSLFFYMVIQWINLGHLALNASPLAILGYVLNGIVLFVFFGLTIFTVVTGLKNFARVFLFLLFVYCLVDNTLNYGRNLTSTPDVFSVSDIFVFISMTLILVVAVMELLDYCFDAIHLERKAAFLLALNFIVAFVVFDFKLVECIQNQETWLRYLILVADYLLIPFALMTGFMVFQNMRKQIKK